MWLLGNRAKLLRRLDRLAIYNDKVIYYLKHSPDQAQAERDSQMNVIKAIIAKIGRDSLPTDFLELVDSGAIATDASGLHIDQLKAHFRHRNAP